MQYDLYGRVNKQELPNPFRTYSNFVYPKSIKDVFIWASYLYERNAQYRTSLSKVITYFASDITVVQDTGHNAVDTDAVKDFKELLTDTYDFLELVIKYGIELVAMGNVFVSAERIFSRDLVCPTEGCGWQMHMKNLRKGRDYTWTGKACKGTCPQCGKPVTWNIQDTKAQSEDGRRIHFVFRDPDDMYKQHNNLTDTDYHLFKLSATDADAIRRGDKIYIEDTPKVFLDAAIENKPYIEFPQDQFMFGRTNTLSRLNKFYKGWGIPLFLVAFDNMMNVQHLKKFNEAVVNDVLMPTRILSPAPHNLAAGIDDPNRMPMSGASWRNMMTAALKGRAVNPTQWIFSPVPVQETQVGGSKDVIPTELLEYETNQLLADMGIPQEFRQTNFQVVAPSMGLRMFERQWIHVAKSLNKFVMWAADIIAHAHQYEDMKCTLDMTSFVEDDMNKQVLIGMMQGGLIAKTPVLKRLGVDFEDDIKMQIKEQQIQQDAMQEQQENMRNREMVQAVLPPAAAPGIGQAQMTIQMMQQQAQGGDPSQGMPAGPGAPASPAGPAGPAPMPFNQGSSESASLEQMYAEAEQMAQQIYALPASQRISQLRNLKATNPKMHAQVSQLLRDMESQVASAAIAQSKQSQG